MPEALILEFHGVTTDQYQSVNTLLGIDPMTGAGDWPDGLLGHVGAGGADGNLVVFELWDSQQSQQAFMAGRLGSALGQAGVPQPVRAEWLSVLGQHTPTAPQSTGDALASS
jgi:hypothetical protein